MHLAPVRFTVPSASVGRRTLRHFEAHRFAFYNRLRPALAAFLLAQRERTLASGTGAFTVGLGLMTVRAQSQATTVSPLCLRIQMPDLLKSSLAHPFAVIAHIGRQARCAFPGGVTLHPPAPSLTPEGRGASAV